MMMCKLGIYNRNLKQMHVITKIKTKVDVLWQNGSSSIGLDSQTLFPINGAGGHDSCLGQFVLEKSALEDRDASSGARLKNYDFLKVKISRGCVNVVYKFYSINFCDKILD